jgi:uncharacterized membrane protein YfcA
MDNTLILLCIIAFVAGFVDAIVGGGGLIQTPAGLILMPNESVASVIGSLKIPSFTGTFFAARQYLQKVKIPLKRLLLFTSIAFAASFSFRAYRLSLAEMNSVYSPLALVLQ